MKFSGHYCKTGLAEPQGRFEFLRFWKPGAIQGGMDCNLHARVRSNSEELTVDLENLLMTRPSADQTPANSIAAKANERGSASKQSSASGSNETAAADYQAALDYLYSRINYEKIGHMPYVAGNYRLDRMRALLDQLGRPQLASPIVHIAGTKGKGSTAAAIAAGLAGCDHTVGLYTSPHLLKLEERIKLNGECCSASDLVDLAQAMQAASARMHATAPELGHPTFFELTTAMGMLYFRQQSATAAVLEVGLGGRLDSTNVCQPAITVITSISLDHQAQLGSTIESIAGEKAGIVKQGIPIVCTALHPGARRVILDKAAELDAPAFLINRDFSVHWNPTGSEEFLETSIAATVTFQSHCDQLRRLDATTWKIRSLGRHQADNLAGAIATLGILADAGWELDVTKLAAAIEADCPSGRLEVVGSQPVQVVDTAHNPASIIAGLEAIETHFPGKRLTAILSTSRDKDHVAMLQDLLPRCEHLIVTEFQGNPRALPVAELEQSAKSLLPTLAHTPKRPPTIHAAPLPHQAWQLAHELAAPQDLIYATGSFFLAAEILESIR